MGSYRQHFASCHTYLVALSAIAILSSAGISQAADCAPAGTVVVGPTPVCSGSTTSNATVTASTAPATNSLEAMAKINAGIPLLKSDLYYISNIALLDPKVRAAVVAADPLPVDSGIVVVGPSVPVTSSWPTTSTSANTSTVSSAAVQNELSGLQSQLSNLTSNQNAEYQALKTKVANSAADLAAGLCAPAGSVVVGPTPACPTTADLANLVKSQEAAKTALQGKISQVQNQLTSTAQNAVNNVVNTATNQITGQIQGAANTALTNATASLKGLFPGAASCGNFENVYIAELGASTCGKISESSLGNLNDMLSKMFSAQLNSAVSSATSSVSSSIKF
ncbi:MAG: hypothetical protein PHX61_12865 [Alphaproteobacteria bacterium]|nr:hypothetical protein [Alphaproteobacteria bacterium]